MFPLLRTQRLLHQLRHALIAPSRNPRTAVVLGRLLAVAFLVCLGTGLYSHFLQDPLPWMVFPTSPSWLYQLSQGIHITAGIACFPLLFAKLYSVFRELFQNPPVRSFGHLVERGSVAVFVGATLMQLTIGLLNTYQFYSLFGFSFRRVHFALSFIVIGSLAIHIATKLPIITRYWRKADAFDEAGLLVVLEPDPDAEFEVRDELRRLTGERQNAGITGRIFEWIDREPAPIAPDPRVATSRRGFFAAVGVATAAVVGLTAGQSFRVLDATNVFGARKAGTGPQGLPVNKTAESAGVIEAATSPDWTLTVINGETQQIFSLAQLRALPQREVVLPIACVEGWSQDARWGGVRMRDLVETVGGDSSSAVRVTSLQQNSSYAVTELQPEFVNDELTLVALDLEGAPLDIDHGFPARLIAPARPGVLQTKWLSSLEVLA